MQMDRFTIKAQEALAGAQQVAGRFSHQELEGEHLVLALLEQPERLLAPLLQKLGAWAGAALTPCPVPRRAAGRRASSGHPR